MFSFMHTYWPGVWEAQIKAGIVRENDGLRLPQNLDQAPEMRFNEIAKKDGSLYNILKERRCPFYVDRLQGGIYIEKYPYDKKLIADYKELLGENFWGFQYHEWASNYRTDIWKVRALKDEEWTAENIKKELLRCYPGEHVYIEAMTAEEIAKWPRPKTAKEYFDNVTYIYKDRLKDYELIGCDSAMLTYAFELENGAGKLLPEVGWQTLYAKLQICYARGMSKAKGKAFGVYYEPWGGEPFSAPAYQKDGLNEWGRPYAYNYPFENGGQNGGSSRSLQRRIFLYAYLSGAEFMSEEWSVSNVFYDWDTYELSPYGQIKKDFSDFIDKYPDIGDKITPFAAVIPRDLNSLNEIWEPYNIYGFRVESEIMAKAKEGVFKLLFKPFDILGNEKNPFRDSMCSDAVDIVNEGYGDLSRYKYLINLTGRDGFETEHKNCCSVEAVEELIKKEIPCYVEGNVHWIVNESTDGGFYLTAFNHSGVLRTLDEGEKTLSEADTEFKVRYPSEFKPKFCEGNAVMKFSEGVLSLTVPAGGYAFIKFE